MNANPKFLAATAQVDDAAIKPLPNSRKVYVGNLKVPMREVSQSDTPGMFGGELPTWCRYHPAPAPTHPPPRNRSRIDEEGVYRNRSSRP